MIESTLPATPTPASASRRPGLRRSLGWLRRGDHLRVTITSLILIPICFLWIYPFLWMVSAAFKTNNEIFGGLGLIPASPQ